MTRRAGERSLIMRIRAREDRKDTAPVILNEKALGWMLDVRARALRAGWNVYEQSLRNQRQRDPSLVMLRGDRAILAYLRLGKPRIEPPVDRYAGLTEVEVYVWYPSDLRTIKAILTSETRPLASGN